MSENTAQEDSGADYSGSQAAENAVFHLCYVSTETEHFTQEDLVALLGVARAANT